MVRLCFSFNRLPPKRARGGQWVLCKNKDLAGRQERKEMIYEADSDGKGQAANLLAANSERERCGKWNARLGPLELIQRERGSAGETAVPLGVSLATEGSA